MKVMYETPEVKVVTFGLDGKIMATDNGNNDIFEDPWGDDDVSSVPAPIPGE